MRQESVVRPAGTGQVWDMYKRGKPSSGNTYVGLGLEFFGVSCMLAKNHEVRDLYRSQWRA